MLPGAEEVMLELLVLLILAESETDEDEMLEEEELELLVEEEVLDEDTVDIRLEVDEDTDIEGIVHMNSVSLLGPPQISVVLPLQVISQRALPSGAGPPPLSRLFPQ